MAHGHQLRGELSVHRHHLDQPPLPHTVRRRSAAEIDMDQLHPSLPGVATAFATAWVARTRLASFPVVFYAGLFVCVDIAYNVFEREILAHADSGQISSHARRIARRRSLVVLASFMIAMLVAFVAPRLAFGLICVALILHVRPDVPSRGDDAGSPPRSCRSYPSRIWMTFPGCGLDVRRPSTSS